MTSSTPEAALPLAVSNGAPPSPGKRYLKYTIWTVGVVLIIGVLYAGLQTFLMGKNLLAANEQVDTTMVHLENKDFEGLASSLETINNHAVKAAVAANDPILGLASHLPIVGDDFDAIRTVASVLPQTISPALDAVAILPQLTGSNIAGAGSGFNVELLTGVSQSISSLQQAAKNAAEQVAAIDTSTLLDPVAEPVAKLSDGLTQISPALDSFSPYVSVLPEVLGRESETTWFVTMQNLGEARPSGGLLSAWLLIRAEDGKLEVLDQGSNDVLTENEPVDYSQIMPQGYQEFWGDFLGSWLSMNLSANFPDNAALIREGWNSRNEEQVDGVIALGQGTLPYIASAVGDVSVGTKTIAPADLDEYLTVGVYEDFPNVAEKDAAVDAIIAQVFTKISTGQFNVQALVETFTAQSTGDYIQMWSTNPTIQSAIVEAKMDGAMPNDLGPTASARIINGGENKLDIFLDVAATYSLEACVYDEEANFSYRPGSLSVTVTNNSPTSGLPPYISGRGDDEYDGAPAPAGSNHDIVAIYAPVNAIPTEFLIDGENAPYLETYANDRHAYLFDVELLAGESKTIQVKWDEPIMDELEQKLSAQPEVILQPLFNKPTVTLESSGKCSF